MIHTTGAVSVTVMERALIMDAETSMDTVTVATTTKAGMTMIETVVAMAWVTMVATGVANKQTVVVVGMMTTMITCPLFRRWSHMTASVVIARKHQRRRIIEWTETNS